MPNHDFEESSTGWTCTTGAQNKAIATNRCDNVAYPGTAMTGHFFENWNPDQFSGKMYTQLTNLPAGVYKLEIDAFANGGFDAYVYMNDFKTNQGGKLTTGETVSLACGNDIPARFSVFGYINDGDTLEIGLNQTAVSANWIGIDNANLTYYGSEVDAYKLWYNETRASIIADMNSKINDNTKYDKSQKVVFTEALAKGDAATSKEELIEAVQGLQAAADASVASINVYKELVDLCEKIDGDRASLDLSGLVELFFDLMDAEDAEDAKLALDGLRDEEVQDSLLEDINAPQIIIEECTYSTERLQKYMVTIDLLYKYCVSRSAGEGTDYTGFIADPKFTDPNGKGWTKTKGAVTWTGGIIPGFPVAESYHSAFEIYQEIEAPDGIYSLSLNGFCRPDDGETEPAAEIFIDDFATPLMNLNADPLPVDQKNDGFNCYTSNGNASAAITQNPIFEGSKRQSPADNTDSEIEGGLIPNGMEGASVAFSAGRYKSTVYGIVQGGKMKIGLRCNSTHQWALWSNFKLVYEGKSEAAVSALAELYTQNASDFFEANIDNMTSPVSTALSEAINAVLDADGDPELQYDKIIELNALVSSANENIAAFKAFVEANDAVSTAADEYGATASASALAECDSYTEAVENYMDFTTEQLVEYTEVANKVAAALRIPDSSDASDENPIDFTQVIVNNDFEQNAAGNQATGWTLVKREGASGNYQVQNGFNGVGMEFWSNTNGSGTRYDFYQDIANLPAGTYELTVDAANSYNGQNPGTGEGFMSVYAAVADSTEFEYTDVKVEPQTEGCAEKYNTYTVTFNLAEGQTLRIGSQNCDVLSARWCMIDNFRLTYYGKDSQKEITTEIAATAPVSISISEIYSVAGARLNTLQKGINIVKMSNGDVKKIMVK